MERLAAWAVDTGVRGRRAVLASAFVLALGTVAELLGFH
jgi:hypothetical protein